MRLVGCLEKRQNKTRCTWAATQVRASRESDGYMQVVLTDIIAPKLTEPQRVYDCGPWGGVR